jgi:NitT/TauT family transport system ATP-binding protein
VVGPSGCGKSTLLKIVAGLYPPTSGEVLLNGAVVRGPHREVGLVFQGPALMKWRTVLGNVMLQAEVRGLPLAEYRARATDLLRLVGLAGFEDAYPFQLSGGMQQRAAICRALLHDPPLLVMDEPFGALDALTREQMNLELMNLWATRRKTVLFVTHSIPEAVFLSDRILVMSARPGRILEEIEVPLPRPRTVETMASAEFGRLASRIRRLLQARATLD